MLLVQHGFGNGGAGGNVGQAIAAGDAAGVIWSPAAYSPASLRREIRRNAGATQMVDPQLYVRYAQGLIDPRQLPSYTWFERATLNDKARALNSTLIREIVTDALDWQRAFPELTEVVTPAPAISSGQGSDLTRFTAFAKTSAAEWTKTADARPLFLSVPITGALLEPAKAQERQALVGAITSVAAEGVYLMFELDPASFPATYSSALASALSLVHLLAKTRRVRVGYTGLNGWVFRTAGAEATGAGWFQNRRWWSTRHWLDRKGGQRLERAALSAPLALLTPSDLATIRDADPAVFARVVAGPGTLAAALRRDPSRAGDLIPLDVHAAQLFAVCADLDSRVGNGFVTDARRILAGVATAEQLRQDVAAVALTIDGAATDGRINDWEAALRAHAKRLNVTL